MCTRASSQHTLRIFLMEVTTATEMACWSTALGSMPREPLVLKTPFPEDLAYSQTRSHTHPQASRALTVLDTVLLHCSDALQGKTEASLT